MKKNQIIHKSFLFISAAFFITVSVSAQKTQKKTAGNYTYKTECVSTEMDGSETVKAYGTGKGRIDATNQAKKNAVNDILFKGIIDGKGGCSVKPLLNEANVREKHEDYFNAFFADDGGYEKFIVLNDASAEQRYFKDVKYSDKEVTYGLIIQVLRPALKKKMIEDKILTPQ